MEPVEGPGAGGIEVKSSGVLPALLSTGFYNRYAR